MMITLREAGERLHARPDTIRQDLWRNPEWYNAVQQENHIWLIDDQSEGYKTWDERNHHNPGYKPWGGSRPHAGRPHKRGRQRLQLDREAAHNLYLLTKYRRAILGQPTLTEEQVIARLVEDAWVEIDQAAQEIVEATEPYIF
jgi:hypothetical protein